MIKIEHHLSIRQQFAKDYGLPAIWVSIFRHKIIVNHKWIFQSQPSIYIPFLYDDTKVITEI